MQDWGLPWECTFHAVCVNLHWVANAKEFLVEYWLKAYIPPERQIPGVGGWLWAMRLTPEFCVTQRKIYQHVGIFCVG